MLLLVVSINKSSVFGQGLSGWANMNYSTTNEFEDGDKTGETDIFNRNFFVNFEKPITPMLSYQVYLRTNLSDSDITDSEGVTSTLFQRTVEPTVDFYLRNPIYDLGVGYRRREQWSTAHLQNDSRETTEFYYSRPGCGRQ